MANNLPHLLLLNQHEAPVEFKQKPRGRSRDEESLEPIISQEEIEQKKAVYNTSLTNYSAQAQRREQERTIQVPAKLTSIDIEFHSWFNAADYEVRYYGTFGLRLDKYHSYNTRGVFTVIDLIKFEKFLNQFRLFVACNDHANPPYNKLVTFIKSFDFHSTERITANLREDDEDVVYLLMVSVGSETGSVKRDYDSINASLISFLEDNQVETSFNALTNAYELKGASKGIIIDVARNFDSIHTINSSSYGLIRPSIFNTPVRSYPFAVNEVDDDIPIIGIIDTGVSPNTPLSSLIVDGSYASPGLNALVDTNGHGTAVAGFAAFGRKLAGTVSGSISADARILPIKVLGDGHGYLSHKDVGDQIIRANRELGVRLFVLTICYRHHLRTDESHSDYAYYLDQLAEELDILIIISTGNYLGFDINHAYPNHYLDEATNICSPAESMNNLTVGAVGDNLEKTTITAANYPVSDGGMPAPYTRKYHFDADKWPMPNAKLFKPDIVYAGGNYTVVNHASGMQMLDNTGVAGIQYLSIEPGLFFERGIGTSYAAPLVANIAAKLMSKYPNLRVQTIKALMINSASQVKLDSYKSVLSPHYQRSIAGNGVPDDNSCLFSSDEEATIVVEGNIQVGKMEAIPIAIPEYLNQAHKNRALLQVTATLCYAIRPVANYPMAYCPVNIAFGLFRPNELEEFKEETVIDKKTQEERVKRTRVGISGGSPSNYVFKETWSQDAFYKPKHLTNTQKVSYYISRSHLAVEGNKFKLAIECHLHKLLPDSIKASLPQQYDYSLVIRLRENVPSAKLGNSLYDELQLCNTTEVLLTSDSEGAAEAEASL